MKLTFIAVIMLAPLAASPASGQDAPSTYEFRQGYPSVEASKKARDDADLQRALTAYRFWYPTVSMEGIFNGNRTAGIGDNEALGGAAAGPRQVGFTLNSDTPYGSATIDVSKGPMVVELPPGAYIGLVNDHDAATGGKHLIVAPDDKGKIPKGYHVGHTPTYDKPAFDGRR